MTADEACKKAEALCAVREMSAFDVRKKLAKWGVSEAEAEKETARLAKEHFIDDERYCRMFVREHYRLNRWGRVKIAYALRAKGFGDELCRTALAEIDEEEYRQILAQTLKAKARTLNALSPYERAGKLMRFAQSRGFEAELTARWLRQNGGEI